MSATEVLCAYDGSTESREAIRSAAGLFGGSRVGVATVWRSLREATEGARLALPDDVIEGGCAVLDGAAAAEAFRLAEGGAELAGGAGLDARPIAVEADSTVWAALLKTAEAEQAAVVVLGSRGRGAVQGALLGSVSRAVLHHARQPVMVVARVGDERPDAPVLFCFDCSPDAEEATRVAAGLLPGRSARVVNAWQTVEQGMLTGLTLDPVAGPQALEVCREADRIREETSRELAEAGAAIARDAGMTAETAVVRDDGGTWPALVREADRFGAALIVAGSRGRGRAAAAVLGSVSQGLVHHAGRPVLVVPPRP